MKTEKKRLQDLKHDDVVVLYGCKAHIVSCSISHYVYKSLVKMEFILENGAKSIISTTHDKELEFDVVVQPRRYGAFAAGLFEAEETNMSNVERRRQTLQPQDER